MHNDQKDTKNTLEYSNTAGDIFCTYLFGDIFCTYLFGDMKKPADMTPMTFKSCFKVLFKLYDDLKADCKLTIREKERPS